MHEPDTWVEVSTLQSQDTPFTHWLTQESQGSVALLGDAYHPPLPYQSQGAAMAVEDGAISEILLGSLSRSVLKVERTSRIPGVLELYQSIRRSRMATIVQGAIPNRKLYHVEDGPGCVARDVALGYVEWHDAQSECEWGWANLGYLEGLMGFDTITDAARCFRQWRDAAKFE